MRWNDPQFRSAEAGPTLGHYWKNGHEIENTQDYVEEVCIRFYMYFNHITKKVRNKLTETM